MFSIYFQWKKIINCKRIIIENSNKVFINHPIFYPKYNLVIEPNQYLLYINDNLLILNSEFFYYLNFSTLGNVDRFYLFRNEIMKYLPKVNTKPDELFIYIRGGDIFRTINKSHEYYHQPPLCFYESVLKNFKFGNIQIISEDKSNPVISLLLKKYPYIRYKKNNLKLDISYLVNSFNIISALSSFLSVINKLNHNLKFLWEYDFLTTRIRYLHLHYSVYTYSFNYIIYKMTPSEHYKKIMLPFIIQKDNEK